MTTNEIRQKYLNFFKERGHKIIPPAPLVLQNDPTTLFTSSGMQPLVPYLMGQPHPEGKRVADSQPAIRTQDIEEVGDNRHTTFFEMLGNWSFGDYFKKEQIPWIWEFVTKELGLPKERLYVSIFEGNEDVPRDEESYNIWKEIGMSDKHIYEYDVKKNWWSRSGTPDQMPAGEIGGPDSEIFYDFGTGMKLHENSPWKDEECHPNCDCGRFMEIGNSVFIQYKKTEDGKLEELPQKNVDFGGGLERMAAAVHNRPDVFSTDAYQNIISNLNAMANRPYVQAQRDYRIIADHLKAAVLLIANGIEPSNKEHGYVLRRLIRRSVTSLHNIGIPEIFIDYEEGLPYASIFHDVVHPIFEMYEDNYLKEANKERIINVLEEEARKFEKALRNGLKIVDKLKEISPEQAFDLYQTQGLPLEVIEEIHKEKNLKFQREELHKLIDEHKEKSRSASAGTFKGGLADRSDETTRLHTAHHLLLAALQKVVDPNIVQKGSNITAERLRMDFNFDRKLTDEEVQKVESLVNEKIDQDLPVTKKIMSKAEAERIGAQMEFGTKYPDQVSVYFIGDEREAFSKEFCGGPHVEKLSDLGGHVTITKQDNVGSGVRRIYAEIK